MKSFFFKPPNKKLADPKDLVAAVIAELNRRSLIQAVMMSVTLGFALYAIVKAANQEPVLIAVQSSANGQVTAELARAAKFRPDAVHTLFHLREFVSDIWSINASTINARHTRALSKVVGNARVQIEEWRKSDNPLEALQKNISHIREADLVSSALLTKDTAVIRIRERRYPTPGMALPVRDYTVTLQFQLEPGTVVNDMLGNPIGLKIVNFSFSEESLPK